MALGGLYFTDNLIGWPTRNQIDPLNFIAAGEFVAFTADGNGNGDDQLNFSLALEQGEIGLFNADLTAIDCVIYGSQQPDVAQGKCPEWRALHSRRSACRRPVRPIPVRLCRRPRRRLAWSK